MEPAGLKMPLAFLCALLALCFSTVQAAEATTVRELIRDPSFKRGFILWKTQPGKHVRYGELNGFDRDKTPIWGLSQWSSKSPLDPAATFRANNSLSYSNGAKSVTLTTDGTLTLTANSATEYGPRARTAADPWVHLLCEQEFETPASLTNITSARFHIEARLLRSENLHAGDYSPDKHAAQFQIFFTVQNRNPQSPGYGDLLWFGVPIYDNRDKFPKAFKAQDFGGTAKFIFTPDGQTYTTQSAHDRAWITIDKDLLPLMHEALQTAWTRGFLKQSRQISDYSIGGMNLGWELPGTFHVEMQLRALSLKLQPR